MVAHLVRLKLDLLRNSLRRSRAQAIGMILGVLYGAFVVVALAVGVAVLRGEPDVARLVVTIGGAATRTPRATSTGAGFPIPHGST